MRYQKRRPEVWFLLCCWNFDRQLNRSVTWMGGFKAKIRVALVIAWFSYLCSLSVFQGKESGGEKSRHKIWKRELRTRPSDIWIQSWISGQTLSQLNILSLATLHPRHKNCLCLFQILSFFCLLYVQYMFYHVDIRHSGATTHVLVGWLWTCHLTQVFRSICLFFETQ